MSNLTIWNQHKYAKKYDGHVFRFLTYADLLTLVEESGLTEQDISEASRINAHVLMGDESEEIKEGLERMDKLAQQMPIKRMWASCIMDLEEADALDYIYKTSRTKEQQDELEGMLSVLSDLAVPDVKVDGLTATTLLNATVVGIQWVTIDTMTWQQAQVFLPFIVKVAEQRNKAQEAIYDGNINIRG